MGPENWGGIPMGADSDQREHDANASAMSAKDMQSPEKDAPTHTGTNYCLFIIHCNIRNIS